MTTATKSRAAKRQRVEGTLHRSLPATLTIREAQPGQADDGLLRLRLSVSSEAPYLRSSWWDEPWIEVLGHAAEEIDLVRMNGGAVVLANHNRWAAVGNTPLAGIGKVERAWIEGDRLLADITISRREALADLRQDIADGLVTNVSIGYTINERTLTKTNPDGQPNEYRVTSWTPFEVSLVDIPADASVGLGRSADQQQTQGQRYRVVDLPAPGATSGARSMEDDDIQGGQQTANPPQQGTRSTASVTTGGADPLEVERTRAREIRALGRQFDVSDLADAAIDNGTSVDGFRQQVLARMTDTGRLRTAESPEIGLSTNEVRQYSFCRALLAASDPVNAAKLAPFESECSRAAQDKRGDSRDKSREAAITIPVDVLARGITLNDAMAQAAARMLIARAQRSAAAGEAAYRDLVAGTPTAGGNLVATELLGSSFIELLRHAMVLDTLGVTWLRDLNGNIAIPSQTGAATGYWLAESGEPTESAATIGQVTMSPKTVGAFTDYSRRLLLQSSIDVEAFVRADLAAIIGQSIQAAAINGSGSSNQPIGLLNTVGIGSVAGGDNGAAPTYDHVVDLETAVSNANADVGTLAYLTNTRVRGKLRKTQEFSGTNGKSVWQRGRERGIGDVLGYDAVVTNAVPNTLTKGTANGVCSAIAFGNWADMLIGMWGGLDVMLDPYAGATSGTRRVIALQDVDIAIRRVASFAAMKDALTN
ncbi:phage major capsid protein [Thauera propionica]|uniref:phage major capsid protein n=1 Tax=Thauera propionica TaxID=2019431 RepID=UPI0023F328C2|nr:phage major capsid protein [Thauera propionica]MDD3674992.1 phage major capsid protein [Thauera propionica]